MAENVQDLGDGRLEILAAVAPWQHVRPMGEDLVATELVLPENHRLAAVDLGAIVAAGHTSVQRAAPTARGDPADRLRAGRAGRDPCRPARSSTSTRSSWPARCASGAATPTRLPITPDDRDR